MQETVSGLLFLYPTLETNKGDVLYLLIITVTVQAFKVKSVCVCAHVSGCVCLELELEEVLEREDRAEVR